MSCLCLANLLQDDLIYVATKTFILQLAKLWETSHMSMAILSNVWHWSWTIKLDYMQCRWEIAPLWLNRIDCRFQRHSREKWKSRRNNILPFLLLTHDSVWCSSRFFLRLIAPHFLNSRLVLKKESPVSLDALVTFERFLNKKLGFDFDRYFRSFCYMLKLWARKQINSDAHPLKSWKQLCYLFHQVTGSSHSSQSDSPCHQSPNSRDHLTVSYYLL